MAQKKLGFGLMRLPSLDPNDPGKIDMEQTKQMVDTFLERGFTYFDTAWMYCAFQSERAAASPARQLYAGDKAAFRLYQDEGGPRPDLQRAA